MTANALTALAYFAVPFVLFNVVTQQIYLPSRRALYLLTAFAVTGGLSHVLRILTLWYPLEVGLETVQLLSGLLFISAISSLVWVFRDAASVGCAVELKASNEELQGQIQEREKTEKALQESQSYLQTVLSNTPIIVYALDAIGNFTLSEGKGLERIGLKPGEVVGMSVFELYSYDESIVKNLRLVLAGEDREFIGKAEGRVYDNRVTALLNEAGEVTGAIGVATDITGLYEVEVALRTSEERYRTLAENFPNGAVLMFDTDLRYTLVEGQGLEASGLSKEQLQGKTIWEGLAPEYHDSLEVIYSQVLAGETIVHEYTYETHQYLVHALPLKDTQGHIYAGMVMTQDITSQKTVEKELEASRRFLRLVIDNIPQAVFWKDKDSRYLGCNATFAQDAGLDAPKACVGKLDQDLAWFEYAAQCRADDVEIITTGQPKLALEQELTIRNQIRGWFQVNKIPLRDDVGEIIGVLGTYENITEQKQAKESLFNLNQTLESRVAIRTKAVEKMNRCLLEEIENHRQTESALRESEAKFRFLADSIPQQVWIANAEGDLTYVNAGVLAYFHCTEAEVLAQGWQNCIHPEDLPTTLKLWHRSLAQGIVYELMFRLRRADGVYRWHICRALPFKNEAGEIINWFGTNTDIDDYKQTEEALRESEERLRVALAAAQMGTWDWHRRTGQLVWSNNLERLYGMSSEAFDGSYDTFLDRVDDRDRASVLQAFEEAIKYGQEYDTEFRVIWEDGSTHWLASKGLVMYDENDIPYRMAGVDLDITPRKKAEEKIKASLVEKEVLLREIHHRVKNNMQIVSSLLDLQAHEIDNPEVASLFAESQYRIRSMALVHEQLYNSQDLAQINFARYVQKLVNNLFSSYGIGNRQIQPIFAIEDITLNLETAIPCGLIINELVSNSLKHGFPGRESGQVLVKITAEEEDKFHLTIADDGIGFPEDLDFRSLNASLGLKLVNLLTRQLHGEIELVRNAGTQFHLTLTNIHAHSH